MMIFVARILAIVILPSLALAQSAPDSLRGQSQPSAMLPKPNLQVPFNQATNTGGLNALIETGNQNLLSNPGFEHVTTLTAWTASGGTTANGTMLGSKSLLWNSSASAQTLTSTALTIPVGLFARNAEAACLIRTPTGTATHLLQAWDGTNVLAERSVGSSTSAVQTALNFVMPSSGTIALRLRSVASDEPEIDIDDCYLGPARNISQVSQASFFAGMEQAGASGCSYSQNTSTGINNWVALGTGTGCNAWTVSGAATAVGTNDHRITLTNVPPGHYDIIFTGAVPKGTSASSGQCSYRLHDGTTSYQPQVVGVGAASYLTAPQLRFGVTYTTAQSSVTLRLEAADDHNSTCGIDNSAAGLNASWRVLRFPSQTQTLASVDTTPADGAVRVTGLGNHSLTNSITWTTANSAAFATRTLIGRAVAPATANDMGVRMNGLPAGRYLVTASGPMYLDGTSANGSCHWRLWDGTTAIGTQRSSEGSVSGATEDSSGTISGVVEYAGVGDREIVVQVRQASATAGFNCVTGTIISDDRFTISVVPISQNLPTPLLVGSVTSNSAGVERVERATITCATASSITAQSGSWISSVGNRTSGRCDITLAAGIFASTPTCVANFRDASGPNNTFSNSGASSATAVRLNCINSGSACAFDFTTELICMGPR